MKKRDEPHVHPALLDAHYIRMQQGHQIWRTDAALAAIPNGPTCRQHAPPKTTSEHPKRPCISTRGNEHPYLLFAIINLQSHLSSICNVALIEFLSFNNFDITERGIN
jgi:hypothetical protein